MRYAAIILTLLSIGACSLQKQAASHSHTMKLKKDLSLSFEGPDKVSFLINPEKHSVMNIKILAVTEDKQKTVIASKNIDHSGEISFSLPDETVSYFYLVAILEGTDLNGNNISSVETYKIGEQEQINQAKKKTFSN